MRLLIKVRQTFRVDIGVHSWQWMEVVPVGMDKVVTEYRKITGKEAQEIIDSEGLVCVDSDTGMKIYDSPNRDFQKKYKKKIVVRDF